MNIPVSSCSEATGEPAPGALTGAGDAAASRGADPCTDAAPAGP